MANVFVIVGHSQPSLIFLSEVEIIINLIMTNTLAYFVEEQNT
jgi:hypothetical protein